MKAHFFQHVPFEGPGYIADWLEENGYSVDITHFYMPVYQLPELENIDVLVIMGGPMNVYEDAEYPWLVEEKAYITNAIAAGKKVLGVCLGAQLIALCCGAKVTKAPVKEIGWYPVYATDQAPDWWKELLAGGPTVLHWHGDRFDIPANALNLAVSDANDNQAFLLNNNVLGLQFHAEATTASLEDMVSHCREELQPADYIQDEYTLLEGTQPVQQANELMAAILRKIV